MSHLPAIGPDMEPATAAAPPEPVPGAAGEDESGEQPPAASRATDQRAALPQRIKRTGREWKAVAVTR